MLSKKNVTMLTLTKNEQRLVHGGNLWGEVKKATKKAGEVAHDVNQVIDKEARKVGEKARDVMDNLKELKDDFIEGREEAKKQL